MSKPDTNRKSAFVDGNPIEIRISYSDSDSELLYNNEAEAKKFVKNIPELFKDVSGVFLNVFQFFQHGYDSNMDFCKAIKEKLDSLHIKYHFSPQKFTNFSQLLITSNITVNFHDTVCFITLYKSDATIYEFEYTKNGFKKLTIKTIPINLKENQKHVREKFIGSSNPKKIFLVGSASISLKKFLRMVLKSKKLIVIDQLQSLSNHLISELTKWIFDKNFVKYHFIPICERANFFLNDSDGNYCFSLINFNFGDLLPFKKTILTKKSDIKLTYGHFEYKEHKETMKMEQKCHRNEITFIVNEDNFLEVNHKSIIFPEIVELPKNLDKHFEKNIPVIGIKGDLSVICIHDENGNYKFLDAWNGLFGKDLIINFDEEKPKFYDGFDPITLADQYPFAVYNLLQIMSMPPEDVKAGEQLYDAYVITNDEENSVLLEFDYCDETKKAASPAFLMAMIIREHLKAIKKECGQQPTEIGFCILSEYNKDERTRIEEGLKQSCKLLTEFRKVDCIFVDF